MLAALARGRARWLAETVPRLRAEGVWLTGSLGAGTADEWSDVDIIVVGGDGVLDQPLLSFAMPGNGPAGGGYVGAMYDVGSPECDGKTASLPWNQSVTPSGSLWLIMNQSGRFVMSSNPSVVQSLPPERVRRSTLESDVAAPSRPPAAMMRFPTSEAAVNERCAFSAG